MVQKYKVSVTAKIYREYEIECESEDDLEDFVTQRLELEFDKDKESILDDLKDTMIIRGIGE